MKTILALSDLHLVNGKLPEMVEDLAKEADLVLYAGILASQTVEKRALEDACAGELWTASEEMAPPSDWNNIKIGLANDLFNSDKFDEYSAMSKADNPHADLLVIGHINQPIIVWGKKNVNSIKSHMIVCPGSSSIRPIYIRSFPSVAVLKVDDGKISSAKLVRIASAHFQKGWRFCEKCHGLFFAPNEGKSVCPAGGKHDGSKSGHYLLPIDDANAAGQDNWRMCKKCQGLFFDQNTDQNRCPKGGKHESQGSKYKVICDDPDAPGNDSWRWCNKCQGLFFARTDSLGLCPKGMIEGAPSKQQHSKSRGSIYRVERD